MFLGIPHLSFEDVNDIWTHWQKLFIEIIDLHAPPVKKKLIRGNKEAWLTPEITRAISKRNRKFVKNKSSEKWEAYRKQRNLVTSLKRSALKTYCLNGSTNSKHPRKFWKKFNCMLRNQTKNISEIQPHLPRYRCR